MLIVWVDTENIYHWSVLIDAYHRFIDEVKLFIGHNHYDENTMKYFRGTYAKVSEYPCVVGKPDALDYALMDALDHHVSECPDDKHLVISNDKIYHKYRNNNVFYYSVISKFRPSVRKQVLEDFLKASRL